MKILTLILIILLLSPHSSSAGDITAEQQRINGINLALEATVKINLITNNPASGKGTGFFVARNKVLTNSHVVLAAGVRKITIEQPDGTVCPGRIGYRDEGLDLAIVETDCEADPLTIAVAADLGQDVYVIGSSAIDFAVTEGIVAKLQEKEHIVANIFGSSGNSGGPMINSDGEVIGVVRGKDGSDYFIYGITIQHIKSFLQRAGVNNGILPSNIS